MLTMANCLSSAIMFPIVYFEKIERGNHNLISPPFSVITSKRTYKYLIWNFEKKIGLGCNKKR